MKQNISIGALLIVLLFAACKGKEDVPPNPFDDIDYGTDQSGSYAPDPTSMVGIYENVLRVYCDNPGCHDGSFEPDFRSVQSSWSTLVYHDINKNTADSAYSYRVVPGDPDASILWRRITQGDAALQQMPATGQTVPDNELQNIRTWIENGALDMFGNAGSLPNGEPQILGYLATDQAFIQRYDELENRIDSLLTNPFKIPQNTNFNVIFLVEDDSTAVEDMQVNQLKLSMDINDFSSASTVNAFFVSAGGFNVWVAPVNSANYGAGDTVYMRYYCNDGDQSFNTEFPREDLPDAYKTYSAFYVIP